MIERNMLEKCLDTLILKASQGETIDKGKQFQSKGEERLWVLVNFWVKVLCSVPLKL